MEIGPEELASAEPSSSSSSAPPNSSSSLGGSSLGSRNTARSYANDVNKINGVNKHDLLEDDDEGDVCRIYQNPGDADNPLQYPRACSGRGKFVHQDCFLQWLNHSNARQCKIVPEDQREDATNSMVYEAIARLRDPVYGYNDSISRLQKQVMELQTDLAKAQAQILNMKYSHEIITNSAEFMKYQKILIPLQSYDNSSSFFSDDNEVRMANCEPLWS